MVFSEVFLKTKPPPTLYQNISHQCLNLCLIISKNPTILVYMYIFFILIMFVTNQPAMIIVSESGKGLSKDSDRGNNKNEKYLLIGDIHLGLTSDLRRKGVSVTSQVKDFVARIKSLRKQTKATHIVMIGDVKHKVTGVSWQEEREIPEFLSELSKMFKKIIIVKGNHDGHIEKLVKMTDFSHEKSIISPDKIKNKIRVVKSLVIGDYFITHGHRTIKTNKSHIIIGHNQPAVKLRDRIGVSYILPCWIIGPIITSFSSQKNTKKLVKGQISRKENKYPQQELIIMPAFNPLSGSGIVNENEILGPVAKYLDKEKATVHLLDGTDIGLLKDLKIRNCD